MAVAATSFVSRSLLHGAVLFIPPLVLRLLGLRPARRVLVFYCAIVLVCFVVAQVAALTTRRRSVGLSAGAIYLAITIPLLLVGSVHADNTLNSGALMADTAGAIFQTDVYEAIYYLLTYVSPSTYGFAGIWLSLFMLSGVAVIRAPHPAYSSLRLVPVALALLVTGVMTARVHAVDTTLMIQEGLAYRMTLYEFRESRKRLSSAVELQNVRSSFRGHVIVVIGESLSRHHMGLYGYPRNTTPHLSSRIDELVVFEDVIATSSHTVPSLMDAFSLNSRAQRRKATVVHDLLSIAKRAGIATTWLSNQNAAGIWENPISALADVADEVRFHSTSAGRVLARRVFDDAMLSSLADLPTNGPAPRLTFLHMMAAHSPYCDVIPESYRSPDGAQFKMAMDRTVFGDYQPAWAASFEGNSESSRFVEHLNCYDSAVQFVDHVVEQLIARLEASSEPTLLVFVADHGEAPLLGTGHESRDHSHFHVEVPLIVWQNAAFHARSPERLGSIAKQSSAPISLIDLGYSLVDALEIEGIPNTMGRSFFSEDYRPFPRTTLHESVGYDEGFGRVDPVEEAHAIRRRLCRLVGRARCDKFWAHRVNSIGSLLEARTVFPGVELDVVFDIASSTFRVHHPPSADVGLTLEAFLDADSTSPSMIWLDWKNASASNLERALARLEILDSRYDLKGRTLVETSPLQERTALISEAGWRSSYYLPTVRLERALERDDEEASRWLAEELIAATDRHRYNAVSFDMSVRPFIERFLRTEIETRGLHVYAWDHRSRMSDTDLDRLTRYAEDDLVEVVLVGFESPFDL